MSLEAIKAAIPHREPFLLIDEIVEQSDDRIVCRKTFTGKEFWYAGHFPDFPLTPGVILCEAAMQAGAVLLANHAEPGGDTVPVATRADNVKFKNMVLPGDTVDFEVTLDEQVSSAFFLTAKATVRGKVATRFNFACTLAPRTSAS
ncbi:3-hydroxyacyl-ACP dehydratase FabZ family protein [Adhaeretor mobilis]|uniref:3-hydroxyacyl-[acyl-carrier-protein] dehydratase FabZ n=1 Tax=Adhaeretor mobilis TaxID=1930276 RepID=A0A517MUG1_9BACT|nr:3-hydroxyacyl-ACP dehydratase FabZ family protein [Adhaeretor mobilis]QDS98525.1 3-hydroxyacyl-[acyl-carrier-protein] dehydratase FabZ [Adhaeretor mobilis]